MSKRLSLFAYVKKRNGVPLGAKRSLRNMLYRSFGASSFAKFWNYWNPIWNFYLTKLVLRPVGRYTPSWVAVPITFLVSGSIHDLAISVFYQAIYVLFTPWFGLMGSVVVLTEKFAISFASYGWPIRALANSFFIASSFSFVYITLNFC